MTQDFLCEVRKADALPEAGQAAQLEKVAAHANGFLSCIGSNWRPLGGLCRRLTEPLGLWSASSVLGGLCRFALSALPCIGSWQTRERRVGVEWTWGLCF